ncbi:MAG: DinB family protein [Sphingobacteriales bacterium]|nr:DinB family protein [Sphingobacteriales bacterium]
MNNQLIDEPASVFTEQIIKQVLQSWISQNRAVTSFFNKYSDDAYLNEVAPGRNRAIYLLGHLTATNDALLPLLGLGEKLFPELEAPFIINADDKAVGDIPSVTELKQCWEVINTTLTAHFSKMRAHDWLDRHTKVSAADFANEPLRNKLNVLLGRTNHQSYHLGQLNFLKEK